MKHKTMILHPYKWPVLLYSGGTEQEVMVHVSQYLGAPVTFSRGLAGFCATVNDSPVVMWLEDGATFGAVAHEAMHVVMRVLRKVGVLPTADAEEAYCYLQEYVVDTWHEPSGWEDMCSAKTCSSRRCSSKSVEIVSGNNGLRQTKRKLENRASAGLRTTRNLS